MTDAVPAAIDSPPPAEPLALSALDATIAETERVRAAMTRDFYAGERVDEYLRVSNIFSCSELYPPTIKGNPDKDEYKRIASAQAYAKIARGVELGIGPSVSMSEIDIIEGKPSLSSALMAALIRRSPRYDYREITCTPDMAEIEFLRDGVVLGVTRFSIADAKRAGLDGKKNWQRYPDTMCWWRAMSKGANRHCPDVFGGAVYAPGELRDVAGEAATVAATTQLEADAKAEAEKRKTARSVELKAALAKNDTDNQSSGGETDAPDTGAGDDTESVEPQPPAGDNEPAGGYRREDDDGTVAVEPEKPNSLAGKAWGLFVDRGHDIPTAAQFAAILATGVKGQKLSSAYGDATNEDGFLELEVLIENLEHAAPVADSEGVR